MEELFRSASFFLQSRLLQQGWQWVSPSCSGKGTEKEASDETRERVARAGGKASGGAGSGNQGGSEGGKRGFASMLEENRKEAASKG